MSDQESAKEPNPDMMTNIYRLAVVILLAGILVLQWQILGSMDTGPAGPTWADFRAAPDSLRQEVLSEMPLVRAHSGSVVVRGTISLDDETIAKIRGGQ